MKWKRERVVKRIFKILVEEEKIIRLGPHSITLRLIDRIFAPHLDYYDFICQGRSGILSIIVPSVTKPGEVVSFIFKIKHISLGRVDVYQVMKNGDILQQ